MDNKGCGFTLFILAVVVIGFFLLLYVLMLLLSATIKILIVICFLSMSAGLFVGGWNAAKNYGNRFRDVMGRAWRGEY